MSCYCCSKPVAIEQPAYLGSNRASFRVCQVCFDLIAVWKRWIR
jgi:hypothetical protein